MEITHNHLHTVEGTSIENFQVSDLSFFNEALLDEYSQMKHGSHEAIFKIGGKMGAELLWLINEQGNIGKKVILPVAYKEAPPACFFLAQRVAEVLRPKVDVEVVKVYKDSVTTIDYANSSKEEREADLGGIGFSLTEPVNPDALYVVVDDVRVTGGAEREMLTLLEEGGAREVLCLNYFQVADGLLGSPEIESVLNTWAVKGVQEMLTLVQHPDFCLTIRFIKRLLGLSEQDFNRFLQGAPNTLLARIAEYINLTGGKLLESNLGRLEAIVAASTTPKQRIAVYEVNDQGGNALLNVPSYSRFKYGNTSDTTRFAWKVSELIKAHDLQDAVILASPYRHVPTAAANMTEQMYTTCQLPRPAERLHRLNITDGDYATMTQEERDSHFNAGHISVPAGLVEGKRVVIIDDICMTGTHERALHMALTELGATEVISAYIINAKGADLPPHFESQLNEVVPCGEEKFADIAFTSPRNTTVNLRLVKRWASLPAEVRDRLKAASGGWALAAFDSLAELEGVEL